MSSIKYNAVFEINAKNLVSTVVFSESEIALLEDGIESILVSELESLKEIGIELVELTRIEE